MESLDTVKKVYNLAKTGKKVYTGIQKVAEMKAKKEEEKEEKKGNLIFRIIAAVAVIAAVCGIAYAVYRYLKPDYLEDFDEDDFEDEFFEDEAGTAPAEDKAEENSEANPADEADETKSE